MGRITFTARRETATFAVLRRIIIHWTVTLVELLLPSE
jgi:hypothetical protein